MGSATTSMAKKFQRNTKEVTKSLQNEAQPHLHGEIMCLKGMNIKLRLIFPGGKGTRKAAKLQIKGNIIKIGMRNEKQFSSPPSGQGAKGKAPLGFFQVSHPMLIQVLAECAVLEIREEGFFWRGKLNQTPTKSQATQAIPWSRLNLISCRNWHPRRCSQLSPVTPCPALSLNFISVLSAHRDEDPRLWSPDSFPATEVNDLIPRDSHLLLHYPCVIPAMSSRIKLKSNPAAELLLLEQRWHPGGHSQATAL